jgi:hypothetical protein
MIKHVRLIVFAMLIPFIFITYVSGAEEPVERLYTLPGHGKLRLEVPKAWVHNIKQPANGLPPTIIFNMPSSNSFLITVMPIWPSKETIPVPTDESTQRRVINAAEAIQSQSVKKLEIIRIKGISGYGYYFSATDPSPKIGKYKHMAQGIIRVGELSLPFSIVANDNKDSIFKEALKMMMSAKHL